MPRLAGWRAYNHFSLVRVADLNSVLRANFGAYKNQIRAAFYFSTEFLGCAECECFAGAVSYCNFALCVGTELTCMYCARSAEHYRILCSSTSFYLCACLSHPHPVIARLQEFPQPPPYRAQHIPASHKHSSTLIPATEPQKQLILHPSHNHAQPPSYQAQLNTTGKCETLY